MTTLRRRGRRDRHFRREDGRSESVCPVPTIGKCPQSGKLMYLDEATALDALNWLQAHPSAVRATPIRVYRCRLVHCEAWHTTSKERR